MKVKRLISAPFSKWWIPYFILFSGLLATVAASWYISKSSNAQDELRFRSSSDQIQESISDRLDTYTSLLQASAGLFDASENVTGEEFRNFSERLQIRQIYPGIQGIGYIRRVLGKDIGSLLASSPVTFRVFPPGDRSEYYPILYIEPLDTLNLRAVGYDMFTEKARREAIERARDTALPAISRKVTLIQETGSDKQPGFLLFVPLYSTVEVPANIEERREQLVGFVYSPFWAADFFRGVLGSKYDKEIDFQVYDSRISQENLLHSTLKKGEMNESGSATLSDMRKVTFAGETWILTFKTRPDFDRSSGRDYLPLIFAGGIAMSLILFFLSQLQYRGRRIAELHNHEIKRSEMELQRSNIRTTDILESITDGFIAFDKEWRFTYVNHTGARTLGRTSEELLGKSVWREFPGLDKSSFGKLYRKARRLNKPLSIEDYFEPFSAWFLVRAYPTKTGLSLYFQDISQRKEIERRKDEFIGIASHELKTPVTSIKAFTQILQQVTKDKKSGIYLARMNQQIDKLTLLINDLLDVSRMQSGKIELRKEKFSLSNLVRSTVETLQEVNPHRVINQMIDKEFMLDADEDRIGQVIVNFINNALKYSPEAEPVEVIVRGERGRVIVHVTDKGLGIEKKYLGKVFERFFRLSSIAEKSDAGLGMGLYISS